jgi:RNA polymerase sigma factor FliA
MAAMDPAEIELWQRYRRGGDSQARDQLFSRYLPWAAAIARSVHLRVRTYPVDREDFIQNANIGLMDAMSRYDPERGIAFPLYAKARVRGAVFNGLKAILGDRPVPQERRFSERLETIQTDGAESAFDEIVGSIIGLGIGYLIEESGRAQGTESADASRYTEARQVESRVVCAVAQLPDRLQAIIRSHYFEHVPFQEIAAELGVTKGRVSQLHHAALAKMRDFLRNA